MISNENKQILNNPVESDWKKDIWTGYKGGFDLYWWATSTPSEHPKFQLLFFALELESLFSW